MRLASKRSILGLMILLVGSLLACCSNDKEQGSSADVLATSLKIASYNLGLALNFVPYTAERLETNRQLLSEFDVDVICFQEIWYEEQVSVISQALAQRYPYILTAEPEQRFSTGAACSCCPTHPTYPR